MISKGVPWPLQVRIRNYIFFVEHYNKFHNPGVVFKQLPHKLQMDLYQQAYSPTLTFIMDPVHFTDIRALCHGITEQVIQPETTIFQVLLLAHREK